jgi:DNA-binding NarL/FixJ family response regulator
MNILVIDDDQDDIAIFCEAFHEIFPHSNCYSRNDCVDIEQALQGLPTLDVIFLDGHIFPVSSRECLLVLKKVLDSKRTKIVIHTGSVSPTEVNELLALGASAITYKASSYEKLKELLATTLADYGNQ